MKTLKVFLGSFSFIWFNKALFLFFLKSRIMIYYSFIAYLYENMPIRLKGHLPMKYENIGLDEKEKNVWSWINNGMK